MNRRSFLGLAGAAIVPGLWAPDVGRVFSFGSYDPWGPWSVEEYERAFRARLDELLAGEVRIPYTINGITMLADCAQAALDAVGARGVPPGADTAARMVLEDVTGDHRPIAIAPPTWTVEGGRILRFDQPMVCNASIKETITFGKLRT
jgi:hypothetical protein